MIAVLMVIHHLVHTIHIGIASGISFFFKGLIMPKDHHNCN